MSLNQNQLILHYLSAATTKTLLLYSTIPSQPLLTKPKNLQNLRPMTQSAALPSVYQLLQKWMVSSTKNHPYRSTRCGRSSDTPLADSPFDFTIATPFKNQSWFIYGFWGYHPPILPLLLLPLCLEDWGNKNLGCGRSRHYWPVQRGVYFIFSWMLWYK